MFIMVMDSITKDKVFQGDAEEFLSIQDYDSEIEEILNKLESPCNTYVSRYDNMIIARCKE